MEIDLSHTLDEQKHKQNFLINLNSFSDTQYTFVTHRVAEQRGSFTNIVHNAVMEEMQERYSLTPLLLYPDGVAYLCRKGKPPAIDGATITAIAERVAGTINAMTSEGFQQFIRPMNMGITVDNKCLELNLPFGELLTAMYSIIQRRMVKPDKVERLATDSIKRTRALLAKRGIVERTGRQH